MKVYMVYGEQGDEFVDIAGVYSTEEKAMEQTDLMNSLDCYGVEYYYFDYEVE